MSFERLRVYHAAVELRREVDKLRLALRPGFGNRFSHLDDAVDSIENNVCEGSDTVHPGKRANFFDIAKGSTHEARSCLRSLDRRGAFAGYSPARAIILTLTIAKMLTKLIAQALEQAEKAESKESQHARPRRRSKPPP